MSTEPIAIRSASPSGGPADIAEPGAAVSPVPEPFMAGADEGVAVPASVAFTADVPAAATTAPERGSAGSGAADQGVAANLVAIPAAAIDGQAERDSSAPCRLRLDVISLVPEAFAPLQGLGVIGRALRAGIAEVHLHNPRDFATDRYRKVDDVPYGGGAGMVLKPEPVYAAFDSVPVCPRRRVLLMSPQGRPLHQRDLQRWATDHDQLVLLCGHYEGFDERIRSLADEEVSLGDFVLTGGELPAMVIINGVVRLLPGTVGTAESLEHESHSDLLLEHPHYTRPPEFQGMAVPEVLRSGDHGAIARWRLEQQLRRTSERRPDLFARWQEQQQEQQKKEG